MQLFARRGSEGGASSRWRSATDIGKEVEDFRELEVVESKRQRSGLKEMIGSLCYEQKEKQNRIYDLCVF